MNKQLIEEYTGCLEFLDGLQESGVTNMFGASPYIQSEYGVDKRTAKDILVYWMETYAKRKNLT